jgi:hypothetical protein
LETGSDVVHALVGDAAVVATSAITYAETRAGLARLRREGSLTVSKYAAANREFEHQWPSFLTLDATNALCRTAGSWPNDTGYEASTASTWRRSLKWRDEPALARHGFQVSTIGSIRPRRNWREGSNGNRGDRLSRRP